MNKNNIRFTTDRHVFLVDNIKNRKCHKNHVGYLCRQLHIWYVKKCFNEECLIVHWLERLFSACINCSLDCELLL